MPTIAVPRITITIIPPAKPLTCPACSTEIPWRRATVGTSFVCRACSNGVRFRGRYLRVVNVVSMCLPLAGAYAAGIRGDALLGIALFGAWPTAWIVFFVTIRLFPPELESTGEYRAILYGSVDDGVIDALEPPAGLGDDQLDDSGAREAGNLLFPPVPDRWSVEGIVLAIAALVLAAWMVWTTITGILHGSS